MNSISTYAFINAKVRAMRSNLLSAAFYKSMINAHDQLELYHLLTQSRFQKRIEALGYHSAAEIEQQLFMEEVDQLLMIEKYSREPIQSFIKGLLERYDAEKLKNVLRCWYHKGNVQFHPIQEKIIYNMPVDAILKAPDLATISALLLQTPFSKSVLSALPVYQTHQTLFPVELAIDRDVFRRLMDVSQQLNRKDNQIVRRLLGIEIDIKNLGWIGRFKTYYQLPSAEIITHLLPQGYRLSIDHIRKVLAGGSLMEVLMEVLKDSRLELKADMDDVVALDTMEHFLYEILLEEAKHAFSQFPFSVGAILGYFYLMRIETRNIRTLFQAKGYGLTAEQTDALLVY